MSEHPSVPVSEGPEPKALPPELRGWNWGAFFLNWVWGLAHNTWIALLMFVPGVNLVMPFVLGAKGNEWAWANNTWRDVEHFKRVQRIWARVGFGAVVGLPAFIAIAVIGAVVSFRATPPYEQTVELLQNDPTVQLHLGEPIEASWWVNGHMDIGRSEGWASLSFDIDGPRGTATVYVDWVKAEGAWSMEDLHVVDPHGVDILDGKKL